MSPRPNATLRTANHTSTSIVGDITHNLRHSALASGVATPAPANLFALAGLPYGRIIAQWGILQGEMD